MKTKPLVLTNLDESEAFAWMQNGWAIGHALFLSDEYVRSSEGKIIDERGLILGPLSRSAEFFQLRRAPHWGGRWKVLQCYTCDAPILGAPELWYHEHPAITSPLFLCSSCSLNKPTEPKPKTNQPQ